LPWKTGGRHRYSDLEYRAGDAFLFRAGKLADSPVTFLDRVGRESSVSIPMREPSRSINLSNAVALVVYEAWRQIGFLP